MESIEKFSLLKWSNLNMEGWKVLGWHALEACQLIAS